MRTHRFFAASAAVAACTAIAAGASAGPSGAQVPGPALGFASWTTVFDFVAVGSSTDKALVATNYGKGPLTISSLQLEGEHAADYRVVRETCIGKTLALNETCTITVRYSPSAPGTRVAQLKITDSSSCPDWMHLAGSATATTTPITARASSCSTSSPETPPATAPAPAGGTTTVTTTTTTPAPAPVSTKVDSTATKACVSRRTVTYKVKQPKTGTKYVKASFSMGGKTLKATGANKLATVVDLRGKPRGRYNLRVTLTTARGNTVKKTVGFTTCIKVR